VHAAAIRGLPSESGQPAAQAPASERSVLFPACYLEASSPSPLPACHGKDPASLSRGPFSGKPSARAHHAPRARTHTRHKHGRTQTSFRLRGMAGLRRSTTLTRCQAA
jgi:hypothetical protein